MDVMKKAELLDFYKEFLESNGFTGIIDAIAKLHNAEKERDEALAKLAAMEAELRVYKEASEKQEAVPADKPARITEQDARDILEAYWESSDDCVDWLKSVDGRALLNKLNADREQVPAVAVPDDWREAVQEFVDRCESGNIKSRYTYAKFKELLAATPPHSQQSEPAVAMTEKSYFALADELFELGGDAPVGEAPNLSEIYAILDRYLATTPPHSQQSAEVEAQGDDMGGEALSATKIHWDEFESWWEDHGQYIRAGGGQYEKTFAWKAWNWAIYQNSQQSAPWLKDHQIAEVINAVSDVAKNYSGTQQLRERIAGVLRPVLRSYGDRCPSHESEQGGCNE